MHLPLFLSVFLSLSSQVVVESLDCLQTGKAVQNAVWCIGGMLLPGPNCWSLDLSTLHAVWKPGSKDRSVLEQGLLPFTWPVDCIAYKFVSTAVPSLILSSCCTEWARATWKSGFDWGWSLKWHWASFVQCILAFTSTESGNKVIDLLHAGYH